MSIYLGEGKTIVLSDMQGPAPDGFHVPLNTEWQAIYNAFTGLGLSGSTNFSTYLKMPIAGFRNYYDLSLDFRGSYCFYWSSTPYNANNAYNLDLTSSNIRPQSNNNRSYGYFVRCIKNSPTIPTSSWNVLYQGSGSAGIYYNSDLGLISISSDGTTWYTLMDKNLGATTVYNYGDTMTEANCGKVYQRGNNYGFSGDANYDVSQISKSSTQVNVTGYGPGNYYESSTWITANPRQSSANNGNNLRGGVSQGTSTKIEPNLKEVYLGDTKAKAVYVGTTLIREPKREDNRPNVDVLYSGAGGTIKHGYDSNYGEILLHKSNGDELIIADRNIGANTFGTGSQAYGGYYTFGGGTAPTGYHIPTSNEINTLVSYYNSITGTATSSARDYVLMPYAGTSTSDHEYKGYYWSSTSASNGAYALVISSQFFLGDQKMGKTALFTVRPFKDT